MTISVPEDKIRDMELRGEYLSVSQVASMANRTTPSIRRTILDGNVPGAIKVGETWLIPKERASDGTFSRRQGERKNHYRRLDNTHETV